MSRTNALWVAVALVGAGCNGQIGDLPSDRAAPGDGSDTPGFGGGTGGTDWIDPTTSADAVCAETGIDVGPTPLRRLTRLEYNNTVRDLLGDTSNPADSFPADEQIGVFATGAPVSPILAERYMQAAEAVSATAVSDLGSLLPCSPGTSASSQDACARQFIEAFGRRAYRRPLEGAEIDSLFAVYSDTRAADGFEDGIRVVTGAMLQSPYFLYRPDLGEASGTGTVALTGYEVASRLSYFLWSTMPDDELLAAAAAGELDTAERIEVEARRLLADPRAHNAVQTFFAYWLGLNDLDGVTKDSDIFPQFTPELATAMGDETRRFVEYVLWEGDASLPTLLTAPIGFVNGPLARVYGVSGVSGSTLMRVDLDPTERAGIVTQASMMAINAQPYETSPVLRGKWVREHVLCQEMTPPPADLMIVPPPPDPDATTREKYEQHSVDPACSVCHQLMDPIGFGFEGYDAIGRFRTEDDGMPVDTSGEVIGSLDIDGTFNGAVELAHKLAGSRQVRACMTVQWFTYALGRGVAEEDACSARRLLDAFEAADGNMLELVVALTTTDAFRHRQGLP